MYRYSAYIAVITTIVFSGSQASSAPNFHHSLASLLTTKAKPSAEDFDEIFKTVIKTEDYQQLIAAEANPDGLAALLDDVRVVAPVADSGTGLRGSASSAVDSRSAPEGSSTGLALPEIELTESHEPVTSSAGVVHRPMARMAASAGVSGPVGASATVALSTDPATAQFQSTKYIITTIDTLVHVVTVLDAVQADVNAGNYLGVVTTVDEQCNFMLSKLADEAVDKIFTRGDTAAKWKDALKQVEIQVSNYVATKPGPETWPAFKDQVLAAIRTLVDYAVVARATMEASTTPPPGASNEQLEQQLQNEAIDTGCMCLWKCLFSVCGGRGETTTTASPASVAVGGAPSTAATKTLQLALFIDSTVATIQAIIDEIRTLDASGSEGQQRLKNLQLRIGLRLMSMLKQAIANDALEKIYDTLKGRTVYLLGSVNGVSSAGAWDTIKGAVSDTLAAIISDLNASKPTDVFTAPSGGR